MISNRENPNQDISSHKPITSITGIVVHGKGRGRTVGMPTANVEASEIISYPNKQFGNSTTENLNSNLNNVAQSEKNFSNRGEHFEDNLTEGVYASVVHIPSDDGATLSEDFLGVTNIGHRPTVDNEKTIETHILDFDRDIYDKTITIDLIEFLRGIKKFDNLEEVKKQVEKDIARTKEIVAKTKSLTQTGCAGNSGVSECGKGETSECVGKPSEGKNIQNEESKN